MRSVTVRRRIDTDQLPELAAFLGKEVDICITEREPVADVPARWKALWDAAGQDLIDEENIIFAQQVESENAARSLSDYQQQHRVE